MARLRRPPEWGVEPVPDSFRVLRTFDFFVLWSSLGVGLLVFAAGGLLAGFQLGLGELILVVAVGSVIGSALLAAAGIVGARHGIPTMVSLRPLLGLRGSYVPTALNVVQLVGWAGFELYIMGLAGTSITGPVLGPATNLVWIAGIGTFCVLLAIGGPLVVVRKWLERFAIWLAYASTAVLTIVVVGRVADRGMAWFTNPGAVSVLLAMDLVLVMPISWWPSVSDYNRFGRDERSAVVGTVAGYALANTWFYVLGALLIVVTGLGPDQLVTSVLILASGWVLLLILVDETDNAFANLYSTALSLQNAWPRLRQWVLVTAVALAAGGLAAYLSSVSEPIGGPYETFLFLVGGAFVPLLGVLVGDFLVVHREMRETEEFYRTPARGRIRAFVAWGTGAAVYFYLWISLYFPALALPTLPIGASLPGFAVAFVAYCALARVGPEEGSHPSRKGT